MSSARVSKISVVMAACIVIIFAANLMAGEKGKIPITTNSETALKEFLKGRDLFEQLRAQESRKHFQNAVAEDPEFALAHLYLAQALPTAKGFFEELNKAVALKDQVSEGERFWILGLQAGSNGDPVLQEKYYSKLIMAYPNDERGHVLYATFLFGQQRYADAVSAYNKAVAIDPDYAPTYNMLGYSHRFLEDYERAEKAFQKYIELIPNDPNPHDSYAELLMKMGKYEKSIEHYKKALSVNPDFIASHIGIATNYNFLNKHESARKEIKAIYANAKDDGQRRAAQFCMAVSYADQGDLNEALNAVKKQYEIAQKIDDKPAMAGDLALMGQILMEMGEYEMALKRFEESVKMTHAADVSQEVKGLADGAHNFNAGCVALALGDIETARAKSNEYSAFAEGLQNPFQIRQAHELAGRIALETGDYKLAIAEFEKSNLQNPYNIYRMALAYKGLGQMDKARKWCQKAATFNALNSLNMAFVRSKAEKAMASM
ncbi:MAG: tetratricopeptide repeat protein [candidate division Zixibacteria bacterium]|nr:tetratricopeptide repeat protein [candidate division Zixibacteria bacterium]NIR65510.1 tetratricopeptide repeat protein [candidate division Zixibacteria bacterium]NIS15482.1 tetratricopeptide repeat protein [candidate division Zixibacteria bacterium]NIS47196.1 tetratricopeptide repeat protein [candidate division Zixibacteria bacterium]NIT52001.1 tetratricopeptide repeat protein [candidate division Zixibacteria bacterium]